MALQLLACFEHCNIPLTGIDDQVLAELKKTLILELKASGNDTIIIDGEAYSKNDILEFFDRQDFVLQSATEEETPTPQVHQSPLNSWHSVLAKPEELTAFFEIPDELLDRDKLEEARKLVEQLYAREIIRAAQRQFRDGEYDRLQFILSYAPVFSTAFSYDLKQALYLLFKNQMLKIDAETQQQLPLDITTTLFFKKGFYQTIHFLRDMDADLSRQVMRTAVERSKGQNLSWETKKELFEHFWLLPQDPDSEAYIRKNIAYFEERIRDEEDEHKTAVVAANYAEAERFISAKTARSNRIASRIILGVMTICVAGSVLYYAFKEPKGGKIPKQTAKEYLEQLEMEDRFVDYYFDDKDLIRDYKKLRSNIKTNVQNSAVRDFLIDELSFYCYDQPQDSLSSIPFIPVKPVPECVPMTFSNSSEYSSVLLLFYNEEDPASPVRGALIPRRTSYTDTTLYVLPTDRVFVVFNPVIRGGNTVIASKPKSLEVFQVQNEGYRLKSANPNKDVHLSTSEYQSGQASLTHIYETMEFKRLNRKY